MIGIKIEILSKDNFLLGFKYELLHMMEGITTDKVPVFQDYHVFSVGVIFFTISLMISGGEPYIGVAQED